jgi:hypothetical protein
MNPPSHFLVNAALRKWATTSGTISIPRSFLIGAVLPDVPLTLLWIGAYVYERYLQGNLAIHLMDEQFDQLYFTNPYWIAAHNLLHAPILLLLAIGLLWRFRTVPKSRAGWWFWFAAGCLVHTMLDIPTHVTDGPLLFFPLDWSTRFHSSISYWDPHYHGREFTIFELSLNLILLGYLIGPWLMRRLRRPSDRPTAPEQPK